MLQRLFAEWWNTLQLWILSVLAVGPIPRHVAFVMDGNRRYARSRHKLAKEGHYEGFSTLRRVADVFTPPVAPTKLWPSRCWKFVYG
jgi:ditrans,polycis-polyprenyl diphosphate synthase